VDGDRPRVHVMSGDTALAECFGEDEARDRRDTAETPPRHARDTAETPPRHSRDLAAT